MWRALLDLIFPPACEACRRRSNEALCPACFSQIKFMKPQMGIYAAAAYEGPLRTAIHRFKFKKRRKLAEPLGLLLVKYLSQAADLNIRDYDHIVPVPLHRARLRQRGFNQAELIARVVGRYFELPVLPALERTRDTRAQFVLSRGDRVENVKGAFKVSDSRAVYQKNVLVLDDIYTTGSTMAECCKTLKIAGARRVGILALSRAIEEREGKYAD